MNLARSVKAITHLTHFPLLEIEFLPAAAQPQVQYATPCFLELDETISSESSMLLPFQRPGSAARRLPLDFAYCAAKQ